MFYEFKQNNSGGVFEFTDKLGRWNFIEADNYEEAQDKALELGVYFDGCEKGIDCSCCGDRWSDLESTVDFAQYGRWNKEFEGYFENRNGDAYLISAELYMQYLVDKYGWYPDEIEGRIYYKDGPVRKFQKKIDSKLKEKV